MLNLIASTTPTREAIEFLGGATSEIPQLERNVLSVILTDGFTQNTDRIDAIISRLGDGAFFASAHIPVWDAIRALRLSGQFPDTVTVTGYLEDSGKLDSIGGQDFLLELTDAAPYNKDANWEQWVELIHQADIRRQLAALSQDILRQSNDNVSLDLVLGKLLSGSQRLMENLKQQKGQIVDFREAMLSTIQRLEENQGTPSFASTGLSDLDEIIGGIGSLDNRKGRLIVVAGRPGMGKSMVSALLGLASASHGCSGIFYSFEMTIDEQAERFLSHFNGVSTRALQHKASQLADSWRESLQSIQFPGTTLYMREDNGSITPDDICREVKILKSKDPTLGVVFIDYLGLVAPYAPGAELRHKYEYTTRLFKRLSSELKIDVVLLSQLNRGVESRNDKRPMLSDLRETGAIEQDANIVIFTFRPSYYEQNASTAELCELELIVAKNRSGPLGTVYSTVDLGKFRIMEQVTARALGVNQDKPAPKPKISKPVAPVEEYDEMSFLDELATV